METSPAITNENDVDPGSVAVLLPRVLLQSVNLWSVIGNILIIIIIMKTPELRGFSGILMVNQAIADIFLELAIMALSAVSIFAPHMTNLDISLRLAILGLNGVVAHSLSALSINLYFAICKQQQFKAIMSWNRLYVILTVSWLTNTGLACLYLTAADFYTASVTSGYMMLNLTPRNCWLMILLLVNVIAVPFCSAVICYVRIHNFTKNFSLQTLSVNNMKKLKLSQMIHIVTIIFLLTYIPVVVVISVRVETSGARSAAAIVNYTYHGCKLLIYLKFYKPFRSSARMICNYCCCLCSCQNRIESNDGGRTRDLNVHTIPTSFTEHPTEKCSEVSKL